MIKINLLPREPRWWKKFDGQVFIAKLPIIAVAITLACMPIMVYNDLSGRSKQPHSIRCVENDTELYNGQGINVKTYNSGKITFTEVDTGKKYVFINASCMVSK